MYEPASHWHAAPIAPFDTIDLPTHAEVAVIGGGLHGVSAAYWLARAGMRPLLIERGGLAAGASGRNGGLMVVGTAEDYPGAIARLGHETARAIWQTTVENYALLMEVLREEQLAVGYREVGHLKLALSAAEHEQQRAAAATLHVDGFSAELLDHAQVQELIATPLGEAISGGMLMPHSGTVHSARLVHGLAGAAQRHGARIATETQALAISPDGEGLYIRTTRGDLRVSRAVIALNAWSADLLPVLKGRITPVRGQALAYMPAAPIFRSGCSAALTPTGEYWHQAEDGTIVIGGCRAGAPGGDIGVREQTPTDEVQAAIEQVLPRLFPNMPPLAVARRWAGLMAFTPDYRPIADHAPGLPGVWMVGGFSGHGMPFSMRLGQAISRGVLGEHVPELVPFAYRERA